MTFLCAAPSMASTGWSIRSESLLTWVDFDLRCSAILPVCQFIQLPISPSNTRQNVEQPKSKSIQPRAIRPHDIPCNWTLKHHLLRPPKWSFKPLLLAAWTEWGPWGDCSLTCQNLVEAWPTCSPLPVRFQQPLREDRDFREQSKLFFKQHIINPLQHSGTFENNSFQTSKLNS